MSICVHSAAIAILHAVAVAIAILHAAAVGVKPWTWSKRDLDQSLILIPIMLSVHYDDIASS